MLAQDAVAEMVAARVPALVAASVAAQVQVVDLGVATVMVVVLALVVAQGLDCQDYLGILVAAARNQPKKPQLIK